jgi:hypothetical protein
MRMHVSADIPLSEPNVDSGYVTWFSIDVIDVIDDDGTEFKRIGHARVARIHAENVQDHRESLLDALDADDGELQGLYEVFYEDGWLKESVTDGVDHDVVYVQKIEMDADYIHRNVDLALVRRLCDIIMHRAGVVVIPYTSPEKISHWMKLGFVVSTPEAPEGYLHLNLDIRRSRVDDPDKPGHFRFLPNPLPFETEIHH